jgi:hypothetical protein
LTVTHVGDDLSGASNVAEEPGSTNEKEEIKTISEAIRLHNDNVNVRGVLVSVSELFKMIRGHTLICACNTKMETETYERPRFVDGRTNHHSRCPSCNSVLDINYDYVNAVKVKLQDDEPNGQLDQLNCLLFDADTMNIHPGETIEVKGHIRVEKRKDTLYPLLYAQSIRYERKQGH